jgi:hypothetical protein
MATMNDTTLQQAVEREIILKHEESGDEIFILDFSDSVVRYIRNQTIYSRERGEFESEFSPVGEED